jgi:polyhydroxyalkanoate synthesis regulator protein
MRTELDTPILVKRYAGARLYDTVGSCYVSVEQLRAWRAAGIAFAVIDADTGLDITGTLLP